MEKFTPDHPPSIEVESAVDRLLEDINEYWNNVANLVDFKILLNQLI